MHSQVTHSASLTLRIEALIHKLSEADASLDLSGVIERCERPRIPPHKLATLTVQHFFRGRSYSPVQGRGRLRKRTWPPAECGRETEHRALVGISGTVLRAVSRARYR